MTTPSWLRIGQHVDRLAREIGALQATLALAPDPDLIHEVAAWVDEHHEPVGKAHGVGACIDIEYGGVRTVAVAEWEVSVQIGDGRSHPQASLSGWLRIAGPELAPILAETLSYLREVEEES